MLLIFDKRLLMNQTQITSMRRITIFSFVSEPWHGSSTTLLKIKHQHSCKHLCRLSYYTDERQEVLQECWGFAHLTVIGLVWEGYSLRDSHTRRGRSKARAGVTTKWELRLQFGAIHSCVKMKLGRLVLDEICLPVTNVSISARPRSHSLTHTFSLAPVQVLSTSLAGETCTFTLRPPP